MRKALLEVLDEKVLLSDGAMGTMLFQEGLTQGSCPEQWNRSHREKVQAVQTTYVQAGSDLILTNSFGANRVKLSAFGLGESTEELNRLAVQIARAAIGENGYVLGDMGPCGQLLEPYGDLKHEEAEAAFFEQATALSSEDVDGLILETMPDLEEMKIALKAAKRATCKPVIASMTFQKGVEIHRTIMGQKASDSAVQLKTLGADVIGSNCGVGSLEMVQILREITAVVPGLPLIAQPNAGLPILENGRTTYPETPEEMAKQVPGFLQNGVRIIGGCCGTSPEHIRALRQALDRVSA